MPRVLLTGSTGFIGFSLINYLEKSSLSSLDMIEVLSSVQHPKLKTILYDVDSYFIPKIEDVSDIIHLGAFIPKSNIEANNIDKCTSNIQFTINLLNSIPKTIKRFVFISTLDVYESTNEIIDEDSVVNPISLYGWSKLYCEKMVNEWCNQNNVSCLILRLGHIYGIGEDAYKKLIPETIKKIIQDTPPVIYTKGLEKRSFLNINDCVRCIWKALSIESEDKIVNIVSGYSKSVLEIIKMIILVSGKPLNPEILNKDIITRDYVFDNKKMYNFFGEEQISLYDGLKKEYEYFLSKSI
jgi:UDP-glucose 4-epimerase